MFVLRPFRLFFKALIIDASPRQMAFGFALGVLVGLVPKGNLLAIGLMMLMCSLRVNLGVGLATVFVASWAGMLLDPITHRIGEFLLKSEPLRPLWETMIDTALLPWTDFNNTVVLGSFSLGLVAFVPLYFLSRPVFGLLTPRLVAWAQRFRLVSLLWGGELTGKLA
ncbi:MAG: TIGR03546 family protein [Planctomycetes bacterium]|nr:TIGR03546 family protein [Planctomycetota bacterium]